MREPRSDAVVLFGATGDLAQRKIFPALYHLVRRRRLTVPVIGMARAGWDVERLRGHVRDAVRRAEEEVDEGALSALVSSLAYVDGDYNEPATFQALRTALGDAERPLHFLAIPPSVFPVVVKNLGDSGCAAEGRVVVEKPFGRDLGSARALNKTLHEVFDEDAIFRIDHFMGKEPVQNLLYFRFANSFVEPIWNRDHVASVEITMAESIGVEGRGKLYEEVGAMRDVVQNHLLQVAALLTMEAPVSTDPEAVRDEQVKAFKAFRTLADEDVVRGQYEGYRSEPGVAPDSQVETYAAMRLHVDSWRWADVPFLVRAGKRLPFKSTEVLVRLKRPPHAVFGPRDEGPPNHFRFRLGPTVEIALGARTKTPGDDMVGEEVELSVAHGDETGRTAYERLIGDALEGDLELFARQDGVEAAWRVVEPVLCCGVPTLPYAPGSWGPEEAERIAAPFGGWSAQAEA